MAKLKSNSSKAQRNPNKTKTPPRSKVRPLPKSTKGTPPPPLKQTSISFDKRASNEADPIDLMDTESSNSSTTEGSNFLSPTNSAVGSDDEDEDADELLPPLGIETFA